MCVFPNVIEIFDFLNLDSLKYQQSYCQIFYNNKIGVLQNMLYVKDVWMFFFSYTGKRIKLRLKQFEDFKKKVFCSVADPPGGHKVHKT